MEMVAPLEVGLCCSDLDRLLPFYRDVLGFTHVGTIEVPLSAAAKTGLTLGSYRVARLQTPYGERIKLLEPADPPRVPSKRDQVLGRRTNSFVTFIVADLDVLCRRLADAGVTLLNGEGTGPSELRPGLTLAFCRDPEGNVLEFVHYADLAAYRADLT
ncbi:MAG: VOC family protein [Pseudomonadota bacterium]